MENMNSYVNMSQGMKGFGLIREVNCQVIMKSKYALDVILNVKITHNIFKFR